MSATTACVSCCGSGFCGACEQQRAANQHGHTCESCSGSGTCQDCSGTGWVGNSDTSDDDGTRSVPDPVDEQLVTFVRQRLAEGDTPADLVGTRSLQRAAGWYGYRDVVSFFDACLHGHNERRALVDAAQDAYARIAETASVMEARSPEPGEWPEDAWQGGINADELRKVIDLLELTRPVRIYRDAGCATAAYYHHPNVTQHEIAIGAVGSAGQANRMLLHELAHAYEAERLEWVGDEEMVIAWSEANSEHFQIATDERSPAAPVRSFHAEWEARNLEKRLRAQPRRVRRQPRSRAEQRMLLQRASWGRR